MRRVRASLLVVTCVVGLISTRAHGGGHGAARVAVGVVTFAVFAAFIVVGEVVSALSAPLRSPAVVAAPPRVYSAPPVYRGQAYAAPAPAPPTVVQYPLGRYELRGDGIATAYQWVWIPNPTIPPPPVGAPPAPPAASQ